MVNDFLFELGSEELPSKAVLTLSQALTETVKDELNKAQIAFESIDTFATPRRLGLRINKLALKGAAQTTVRRGPALKFAYDEDKKPSKALQGFAASCGVAIEALTLEETDKGAWLVHVSETAGAKTAELLPTIFATALSKLPIPKPMRWGEGEVAFVRPVHWVLMLLGDSLLPCKLLGLDSGVLTYGHRFHAPEAIVVKHPADYETLLAKACVLADFSKRRETIINQINTLAAEHKARALVPADLLDEVTAIVEWPQALVAGFEQAFLTVPSEALIASMQSHQKCFALYGAEGALLPFFITVSNIKSSHLQQVVEGNEKVMRARLSDAAFFFEHDKKEPLSQRLASTGQVIYQASLGSLLDKTTRMQAIMSGLEAPLALNSRQAQRAAELAKCCLMTGMVGEFPELQGIMGYYYARHDGEDLPVAEALREQYLPKFSGDDLPSSALGSALSLADRLDTLVGIFALGQKPTGDKDPFKLRRHALAVARLLIAEPKSLPLSALIQLASGAYAKTLSQKGDLSELPPFILERLQAYYQSQGIGADIVAAVRARQTDDLYDFEKRVRALADFVKQEAALSLSSACKRVKNLLQQEVKDSMEGAFQESLLQDEAEKQLAQTLVKTEALLAPLYQAQDYPAIFTHLAALKDPVDAFFDQVMVMTTDLDLRKNRLMLLSRLQALLQGPADIALLQRV